MKLVRCFLVLFALLTTHIVWGQSCATVPQPACTFTAIDVATGQPVEAFCVGRGVRFEQCPGRNVPENELFYGVLPGVGTTFFNTPRRCTPPFLLPYTYTPQLADVGMVTVSELANSTGAIPTYYIRTFQVYGTPPPVFSVAPCPNGLVLVTVTDATYDTYTARVGTGPSLPIARNQATSLPVPAGAASVTITGHYTADGLCEGRSSQPIPVIAAPQTPLFTRLTLQGPLPGGTATLDVGQLPTGYRYSLQLADASAPGGFRDVAEVPAGSTSIALPNPAAGCYRLFRIDFCGNSQATSAVICTLSLSGRSTNSRNQLLLASADAGTTYTVTRDGKPLSTFTTILGGLEDADVQCGTTYTYQVKAIQSGGATAVSNPVAIATLSSQPPAQPLLLASFNRNNVVELTPILTAPLPPGSTLRYRRATGGGPPVDFRTVTTARGPRDSTALAELRRQTPCYSVYLRDVCGNVSPESPATCPVLLSATAGDAGGNSATLTWTSFTGPNPGVPATYALQLITAEGTVLSSIPVSGGAYTDPVPPADRQVLRYRLQIGGAGLPSGTFSYSNLATVARRPVLTIPTAFTPNGDGLNDALEVKGKYLRDYIFVVFDRNGQEVFRGTRRNETWDGTIKGHAPVNGAYVWRFQQDNEDGQRFTATGSVTILK